jgi:hypothetical protein
MTLTARSSTEIVICSAGTRISPADMVLLGLAG